MTRKPPRPEPAAVDVAVRLLTRREHSRQELDWKLRQRGFGIAEIQDSLDDLQQQGLLDDGRFVESFVRWRIGQGQGPERIRLDLMQRGISESQAREGLADADVDWLTQAEQVHARRFGQDVPADSRERARQMRFLQYRGFTTDMIRHVMDGLGKR